MENKIPRVGVGVMILKDNKILLGKRHYDPEKATSLLKGAGHWTMPGGKVDFKELLEDAIKRETAEECGLILDNFKLICINQDIVEDAHFITAGFISDSFSGDVSVMEPDKITEWGWFSFDELPSPLYFPSAKIIENYKQNKFYIENLKV